MNYEDYTIIGGHEINRKYGVLIKGKSDMPEILESDRVKDAVYKASNLVMAAIELEQVLSAPDAAYTKQKNIDELTLLFPDPVYVEEIPNEYSSSAYYALSPWLRVTTSKGHFKIGWRKRVISIHWNDV